MKTHVSMGGILYKISATLKNPPQNSAYLGTGKHVNPKGNYSDAKYVSLFQCENGYAIVK